MPLEMRGRSRESHRKRRQSRKDRQFSTITGLPVPLLTTNTGIVPANAVEVSGSISAMALALVRTAIPLGLQNRMMQLGPQELRRRMIHIAPGFLPFGLACIPHERPLSFGMMTLIVGMATAICGWAWWKQSQFLRPGEKRANAAVFGYGGVVLGLMLLFPSVPELGLSVLGILAFGDGSATLVGLLAQGRQLPWNPEKSWPGLMAFLALSIPFSALIFLSEAASRVSWPMAVAYVAPAALVAAIAESLSSRINDNIRVGFAAAVTILITHAIVVGC